MAVETCFLLLSRPQNSRMEKVTAFVFAAGLGTRLYPLTASRPKALVRYQDKPLLEHVITKIVDAGIRDIIVNVHHFPDQIIEFLSEHDFNARVRVSDERAYLRDTAGGLKFAEPFLGESERLLLYNVDIVSSIDLNNMMAFHLAHQADVTLAVKKRETARYFVFDEPTMRLCGWKNVRTGETICPMASEHPVDCAFSGIHIVNRKVVEQIPTVEKLSMTPFYLQNLSSFNIYGFLHQKDEWMDIGKYNEYGNLLK